MAERQAAQDQRLRPDHGAAQVGLPRRRICSLACRGGRDPRGNAARQRRHHALRGPRDRLGQEGQERGGRRRSGRGGLGLLHAPHRPADAAGQGRQDRHHLPGRGADVGRPARPHPQRHVQPGRHRRRADRLARHQAAERPGPRVRRLLPGPARRRAAQAWHPHGLRRQGAGSRHHRHPAGRGEPVLQGTAADRAQHPGLCQTPGAGVGGALGRAQVRHPVCRRSGRAPLQGRWADGEADLARPGRGDRLDAHDGAGRCDDPDPDRGRAVRPGLRVRGTWPRSSRLPR